jgi:hypothetical protein
LAKYTAGSFGVSRESSPRSPRRPHRRRRRGGAAAASMRPLLETALRDVFARLYFSDPRAA